jgi:hypothetical protein
LVERGHSSLAFIPNSFFADYHVSSLTGAVKESSQATGAGGPVGCGVGVGMSSGAGSPPGISGGIGSVLPGSGGAGDGSRGPDLGIILRTP